MITWQWFVTSEACHTVDDMGTLQSLIGTEYSSIEQSASRSVGLVSLWISLVVNVNAWIVHTPFCTCVTRHCCFCEQEMADMLGKLVLSASSESSRFDGLAWGTASQRWYATTSLWWLFWRSVRQQETQQLSRSHHSPVNKYYNSCPTLHPWNYLLVTLAVDAGFLCLGRQELDVLMRHIGEPKTSRDGKVHGAQVAQLAENGAQVAQLCREWCTSGPALQRMVHKSPSLKRMVHNSPSLQRMVHKWPSFAENGAQVAQLEENGAQVAQLAENGAQITQLVGNGAQVAQLVGNGAQVAQLCREWCTSRPACREWCTNHPACREWCTNHPACREWCTSGPACSGMVDGNARTW